MSSINLTGQVQVQATQAEIPEKIRELDIAISKCMEATGKLISGLSSIMKPVEPNKPLASVDPQACTKLGGDIQTFIYRINDITESLLVTSEHIEL